MRILILTENYPPETNAPAARISERNRFWVEQGHQITVVTQAPNFPTGKVFDGYKNKWFQQENMNGVRVVRVKTYIAANAGFLRRILDFLSFMHNGFWFSIWTEKPDVVVGCSPQFFSAVAGWAVALVRRRPFVMELADLWPASIRAVGVMEKSRVLDLIEKLELFLYRQAAAVVALTPSFKKDLVGRGIDAEKVQVVINGVDQELYGPRDKDEALLDEWKLRDKFVIGYIGTHGMAHALHNVIETADLLRDKDDIRFLMVGAGAARAGIEKDAARRGLSNVVFVPRQPKDRMPGFWSLCDVALIHLKDDPVFAGVIPSKIFEAMAMKLPLLFVGPRGDGSEIVERELAGIVVKAEDPRAFAAAVLELVADRRNLQVLAENSLKAAPKYSRARQARDMMSVLENVVERVS